MLKAKLRRVHKVIYILFVFNISLFLIVFSGCGRTPYPSEKNLKFRLNENPLTVDPAFVVDVTGGEIVSKIYSGLVRFDQNLKIVPDLADNFKVSKDGKMITFHLRNGVQFSDGSMIDVSDVQFSWERVLSNQTLSPRRWVIEKIKGAKSFSKGETDKISGLKLIDKQTIEVELEEAFAPFLSFLTMPAAMIISKKNQNLGGTEIPLGAGPFILEEWIPDVCLKFKPNPYYYEFSKTRPSLLYQIIPEDSSAISMISTGELDVFKLPRQQVAVLKKHLNNHLFFEREELNTYYVGFNHRNKYLDMSLRKAVSHAIDKKQIIKNILGGMASDAFSPVPSALLNFVTKSSFTDFSVEKAKEQLSKSKSKNKKIIFLISSGKETLAVASIIQDQLKKVGMKVELKIYDWSSFKEALFKGDFDLFFMSWWADYADSENFLVPPFHSKNKGAKGNRVYYDNPKVDILLETLQTVYLSEEKDVLIRKIFHILKEDLPWIPLWHRKSIFAVSKRIRGFYPAPMYSMDKGLSLEISED